MTYLPLYTQMKREAFINGAVFGKAHTPIGDERELLAEAHGRRLL